MIKTFNVLIQPFVCVKYIDNGPITKTNKTSGSGGLLANELFLHNRPLSLSVATAPKPPQNQNEQQKSSENNHMPLLFSPRSTTTITTAKNLIRSSISFPHTLASRIKTSIRGRSQDSQSQQPTTSFNIIQDRVRNTAFQIALKMGLRCSIPTITQLPMIIGTTLLLTSHSAAIHAFQITMVLSTLQGTFELILFLWFGVGELGCGGLPKILHTPIYPGLESDVEDASSTEGGNTLSRIKTEEEEVGNEGRGSFVDENERLKEIVI